jgi:hypothetical protein
MTIQEASKKAKDEQKKRMAEAKSALAAYWAGSASESVIIHYKMGVVKDIKV